MTTINCTLGCKYQKEGKCMLDDIESAGDGDEQCAYFSPSKHEKKDK